jgi:hypothetical protein
MNWQRTIGAGARWAATMVAAALIIVAAIGCLRPLSLRNDRVGWCLCVYRGRLLVCWVDASDPFFREHPDPIPGASEEMVALRLKYWIESRVVAKRASLDASVAAFTVRSQHDWSWLYPVWYRPPSGSPQFALSMTAPISLVAVPSLLLWWPLWRRRSKGLPERCARCGYDRRGLMGGADAKCPECGTVPGVARSEGG